MFVLADLTLPSGCKWYHQDEEQAVATCAHIKVQAVEEPEATIEEGVVMYPRCTIDAGVTIKSGTLLNNSVTVSHDTTIEKCCYISPGVTISGRVSVKERCFLGTGSLVANDVAIGADSIIGIGSVITKTLPQHTKGLGNPFTIKNIQLQ